MNKNSLDNIISIPLLALRGINVFPGMLMTFDVERKASIEALNLANKSGRLIFLVAQKDPTIDLPMEDDIFHIGTVAKIRQQLMQPGSTICRVMVEGIYRAKTIQIDLHGKSFGAMVEPLSDASEKVSEAKLEALMRSCISQYEDYEQLLGEYSPEHFINLVSNTNPSYVSDYIAQNVPFIIEDKQSLLEELKPSKRLVLLSKYLRREIDVLNLEKELSDCTNEAMSKSQREYYLREEMKIIQQELNGDRDLIDDISEYKSKINALEVNDDIKDKLLKEVSHLSKQPFGSSEAALIRSYLDVCLDIPWNIKTKESVDINKVKKILDRDHYGLEKVKERIIEYLAVKQLSPQIKGGLLCLVGPPGTGKTSIAMSIANATNRKLVRISLGGVHDEAEIRGHRRTYIGAMPGRIISGIISSKSKNPLMVLDEIDKLGYDYKGDPSAALLEVLDPEQNSSFRDNFLEIPFDLSDVFFITTANSLDTIPKALLDRMEVIDLSSYTDEEKLVIAKKYLVPKQTKKHGLSNKQIKISSDVIKKIIVSYTRESGVRNLEREIARVCRKAASQIAKQELDFVSVNINNCFDYLGTEKYKNDEIRVKDAIGLVRGLAWTSVGGEILDVEVACVEGTGKLELTGNLGDVMKESAKAALTCIRSRANVLGIDADFYKNTDIHIHFPEGAIPKDGPSAGITMTTAIVSALLNKPVRYDVAMTGEITLRGRVLPIGGLREKTMAALRNNISTVIIPCDNKKDLDDIDPLVRGKLNFVFAKTIDDVLSVAIKKMTVVEDKWLKSTSINVNSLSQSQRANNS